MNLKEKAVLNGKKTYPKNYDKIKEFIESPERLASNGSFFSLLSSREEFHHELALANHNLKNCKLKLRQHNCTHDSYATLYSEFMYRARGCNECSRDSSYSYAHRYFQALLSAYEIEFRSEEIVKGTKLRVDFFIPQLNRSYEIDGLTHSVVTRFHTNAKERLEQAKVRDNQKNNLLATNLTRILLYETIKDGKFKTKSTEAQFHLIREHFIVIYKEVIGKDISHNDLLRRLDTEGFFQNARVQEKINKLKNIHGNHIVFEHMHDHANILSIKGQQFRCKLTDKIFVRNIPSVLDPFFVCVHCKNKAKQENQVHYPLLEPVAKMLVEELALHHKEITFSNPADPFDEAIIYNSIRVKLCLQESGKEFYMPLSKLRTLSTKQIVQKVSYGNYGLRTIQKTRERRKQKLFVDIIRPRNRKREHKRSEVHLTRYRAAAMRYNKRTRNGLATSLMPEEINALLPKYIHNCSQAAMISVSWYENIILPFFEKQAEFKLITQRDQYAGTNMPLLLHHDKSGCRFFATWTKVNSDYRKHSKIICQHHDCFEAYFKSKASPGNKRSQDDILKEFSQLFNGRFFVKSDKEIRVRTPTEIVHLASGKTFFASLDNFRRKKFRAKYLLTD